MSESQKFEQIIKLEERILNSSGEEKRKLEDELNELDESVRTASTSAPIKKKKKNNIRKM